MRYRLLVCYMLLAHSGAAQWLHTGSAAWAGLGGAGAATTAELWGAQANPASLRGLAAPALGAGVQQHWWLNELNRAHAVLALPFRQQHAAGLALSSVGLAGYRETQLGLSLASGAGRHWHVGARLGLHHTTTRELGSAATWLVDAGLIWQPKPTIALGGYVVNATRSRVGDADPQPLPGMLALGLHYQASTQVWLRADALQEFGKVLGYRAGVQYQPVAAFDIRLGAASQPTQLSLGCGWRWQSLQADVATRWHAELGLSNTVSIHYTFVKGDKP